MNPFSEILRSSQFIEGRGQKYTLDKSWMQGRAIYGGLSTALCLDGVRKQCKDLPPLRSVNVNFIGLASSEVFVKCSVLRRGKSVTFVQAELHGEKGLVSHIVFCFGAPRESKLEAVYHIPPLAAVDPESAGVFFSEEGSLPIEGVGRPAFTKHFDARLASGNRPFSGAEQPSFEVWVRHRDELANDVIALVALADMPPPAIIPLLKNFPPISSMTWMFNIVNRDLATDSGWWLLGVYAEHASQGYSSQNMTVRNDRGELVIVGRQNIAVFY